MSWPGRMKTLVSPSICEIETRMIKKKIPLFYIYSIVFDINVCSKNCLKERISTTILQHCNIIFLNSDFSLDNLSNATKLM